MSVTLPRAGWYPDPSGRFEYRYWDGQQWTAQAATAGRSINDPVRISGATSNQTHPSPEGTATSSTFHRLEQAFHDHHEHAVEHHEAEKAARQAQRRERKADREAKAREHAAARAQEQQQHADKKAEAAYQKALGPWQSEQDDLLRLLNTAQTYNGLTQMSGLNFVPKKNERIFYAAYGAALIEPRRSPGHYVGGYSGFSFRIAKGVRYHVGGTRGHYEAGEEQPTPIDQGSITITNQRVVFQGAKQSREWAYNKLLGYQHDPRQPMTTIHVSNRQKVSGFLYDTNHAEDVHFELALSLAHYQDEVDESPISRLS